MHFSGSHSRCPAWVLVHVRLHDGLLRPRHPSVPLRRPHLAWLVRLMMTLSLEISKALVAKLLGLSSATGDRDCTMVARDDGRGLRSACVVTQF